MCMSLFPHSQVLLEVYNFLTSFPYVTSIYYLMLYHLVLLWLFLVETFLQMLILQGY